MFKRRQELHQWSNAQLREQVVACYATDPDAEEVRAAVILRQDAGLLPKSAVAKAKAELEANGETWKGFPEYITFCFAFDDSDRVAIYMEGNNAVTLREWRSTPVLAEASTYAAEWIGKGLHEFPFDNIPTLYKTAFFEYITDQPYDPGPLWGMWTLPAIGDMVPVREFPPRLDRGEPHSSD